MTKATALKIFRNEIQSFPNIRKDRLAMREAWGIFIDNLCKDHRITEKQYHNWKLF